MSTAYGPLDSFDVNTIWLRLLEMQIENMSCTVLIENSMQESEDEQSSHMGIELMISTAQKHLLAH